MTGTQTLYEHWGDNGMRRLEELFYAKALANPVLKQLFTHHVLTHVDHLTWVAGLFASMDQADGTLIGAEHGEATVARAGTIASQHDSERRLIDAKPRSCLSVRFAQSQEQAPSLTRSCDARCAATDPIASR